MCQRDLVQQFRVDVLLDERLQRRRIGQRLSAEQLRQQTKRPEDVARRRGGVELPQRVVIGRAEESKRRHQRAGRNAGDDLEGGALAGLGPTVQESRAECAVRSAARYREVRVVDVTVGSDRKLFGRLLLERAPQIARHRLTASAGRCAYVGHAGNSGLGHQLHRHGVAWKQAAPRQAENRANKNPTHLECRGKAARMRQATVRTCAGQRAPGMIEETPARIE